MGVRRAIARCRSSVHSLCGLLSQIHRLDLDQVPQIVVRPIQFRLTPFQVRPQVIFCQESSCAEWFEGSLGLLRLRRRRLKGSSDRSFVRVSIKDGQAQPLVVLFRIRSYVRVRS